MSTKTTLKRVALVAVSSLGLGMLAIAPSNAAAAAYSATYSAPTSVTVLQGYPLTTVGTISLSMSAGVGDTIDAGDDMVLSLDANSGSASDIAFMAALQTDLTGTQITANTATNGTIAVTTETATDIDIELDVAGAGFQTAAGSIALKLGGALTSADNGAKVKYAITSVDANGSKQTLNGTLTLKIGNTVYFEDSALTTISPTTGLANIAAGGTTAVTVTTPYRIAANETVSAAETFVLDTTNVPGATLTVTASATGGGTATVVPLGSTSAQVNLLKDGNLGTLTVTYTLTVTAPTNATQGNTMSIANGGFLLTVFGGGAFSGVTTTRYSNIGWLGGNNALYGSRTSGTYVGGVIVDAGVLGQPSLYPSWTFTMSGVGSFSLNNCVNTYAYYAVPALALNGTDVQLCGDGRAGTGTLTVAANGTTVSTQIVNFYGVATKIEVIPFYTIGRAGNNQNGYVTGDIVWTNGGNCGAFGPAVCTDAGNDPAVAVRVTDDLGTPIPAYFGGGGLTASSSNAAVIDDPDYDYFLDAGYPGKTAGILLNHVAFSTASTAKSGDSATVTFRYVNSLGTLISSTPLTLTVGGSAAGGTVTFSLDKTTYQPGERMIMTITAKDSAGNKVFDNAQPAGLSSNKNVVGISAAQASAYYLNGSFVYGDDAGEDLFAPAASGPFDMILYTGTAAGASLKVTATVGDDAATAAANAASDAAAEAIDAANAATDAANLPAEAADAATVAAEEARDAADAATAAVEELATQVAALMAALKAQITTLANTVAKIAKKIKA